MLSSTWSNLALAPPVVFFFSDETDCRTNFPPDQQVLFYVWGDEQKFFFLSKFQHSTEECFLFCWLFIIFRPLMVEMHRSTVSTDAFTQSPSFSNNPKIPIWFVFVSVHCTILLYVSVKNNASMLAEILFTFSVSHPSISSLRYQVSDAAEINNIALHGPSYSMLCSIVWDLIHQ